MLIIGYIHVCQKGDWVRSLTMLIKALRVSGLYEKSHIIRVGIVNDQGKVVGNKLLEMISSRFIILATRIIMKDQRCYICVQKRGMTQ